MELITQKKNTKWLIAGLWLVGITPQIKWDSYGSVSTPRNHHFKNLCLTKEKKRLWQDLVVNYFLKIVALE
jgi:hypothetical protein